jgi:hypothetical protein
MRSRVSSIVLVLVAGSLVFPFAAHAGGIPFFGPIIDQSWFVSDTNPPVQCALSWGAVITVINNIISFLLTLIIVFIAPLMIAYSGFLFVVNPVNSSGKEKAKEYLTNTVVGLVIALSAWLIVDAIMAVLYHPSDPSLAGKTWSQLITSGNIGSCINQQGIGTGFSQAPTTGVVATAVPRIGTARGPCADGNIACSITAILQKAQTLSMNLSSSQATAMSCIAMTESSGNPNSPNSSTGACGTFQITTRPGNWSVQGLHRSPCSPSSSCNDAQCNLQTALLLYGQNGYQPWTGKNPDGTYWNPNAVACVQQYDPGGRL